MTPVELGGIAIWNCFNVFSRFCFHWPFQVGVASLTVSKGNHPSCSPSPTCPSNGYSHYTTGSNQAQEEYFKKGSNPWGKSSYSDLITMALMSSPERKMTLNEIYKWISMNIPYFRNKGDEISSSGWKVIELDIGRFFSISLLWSRITSKTKIFVLCLFSHVWLFFFKV